MRKPTAALVMAALIAACSRGADIPPPPVEITEPPPTAPTTLPATTSTVVGFAVPATVDVAYVQRVLDEIYRLEGEAARHLYAKRVPDAEFNERLEAIFGDPALQEAKSAFGRDAAEGLSNFADPPGNPTVKVASIVDRSDDCIVVRARLSFAPVYKRIAPPSPEVLIQLVGGTIERFNPTPWGVIAAGPSTAATQQKVCSS